MATIRKPKKAKTQCQYFESLKTIAETKETIVIDEKIIKLLLIAETLSASSDAHQNMNMISAEILKAKAAGFKKFTYLKIRRLAIAVSRVTEITVGGTISRLILERYAASAEIKIKEPIYKNIFRDLYFDLSWASSGVSCAGLLPNCLLAVRLCLVLLNISAKILVCALSRLLLRNDVISTVITLATKTANSISLPSLY